MNELRTNGGEVVLVEGRNFGPSVSGSGLSSMTMRFGAPRTGTAGMRAAAPSAEDSEALQPASALVLSSDALEYTAVRCTPISPQAAHEQVLCEIPPGIGAGLEVEVMVAGQLAAIASEAAAFTAGSISARRVVATEGHPAASSISYARPMLLALSGPGAAASRTSGGDTVQLRGLHFPPADQRHRAIINN